MTAVSVIVPARDAAGTLPALLAGLARQEVEHELVVVDAGSTDGTAAVAEARGARVVRLPPSGPAAARNAGAAAAGGRVLAFVDADCAPRPGWLAAALQALDGADLVQGAVEPDRAVGRGPFDRTLVVRRPGGLFESANLVVRRELYEQIGGFESWLLPARGKELGEDVLFGWRAVRLGARVRFAADAVVDHAVFPGDARSFVAERARLRHFPALVGGVPELRSVLLFRRVFLSRRSAAFDAAVAALLLRRPAAGLPYALLVARDARHHGVRRALAGVAADGVGLASLVRGAVSARRLLL